MSSNSEVINQYSNAFIHAIKDENLDHDYLLNEIIKLKESILSNDQYMLILTSINISVEVKKQMIEELITLDKEKEFIKNMIFYMLDKGDQYLLVKILTDIEKNSFTHLGYVELKITSPYQLNQKDINSIVEKVENKLKKKVIPRIFIDESYIAGISIEYDSKILDNSIKTKLFEIKKGLMN